MAVLIANNASGRLASTLGLGQTTLSLQAGQGARFPSPTGGDWFPVTAIKPNGDLEIMRCTARSGDVLTVTRSQEATSEREWAPGDRLELRYTRQAFEWSMVPKGGIILWSGAIANIPAGWALCNGSNGTPDLRNRFVVGAGSTYAVGDTGGADSVTLTAAQMPTHNHTATTASAGGHNHGGTNSGGAHTHTASSGDAGGHSHTATTSSAGAHTHSGTASSAGSHTHSIDSRAGELTGSFNTGRMGTVSLGGVTTAAAGAHTHSLSINSNGAHTHTLTTSTQADHSHSVTVNSGGAHTHAIDTDGAHTHAMTVGNAGSGNSHENRPPYYALAYIMKL